MEKRKAKQYGKSWLKSMVSKNKNVRTTPWNMRLEWSERHLTSFFDNLGVRDAQNIAAIPRKTFLLNIQRLKRTCNVTDKMERVI